MPSENPATSGGDDPSWLLQFYSPAKSIDPAEDLAPQPLANVAIPAGEKYRIGDEIGSGGMKTVHRTYERSTERNIAMAILRDPAASPKKMARFVREARITAALEHPNIVPIYEIGLDSVGRPYFTMKLLGGETLQFVLQRVQAAFGDYHARWPLNRLLDVFEDACNAIGFAHSRGVLHLDLKPANIQVGNFGDVLVLDWGLAQVLEKDPALYPNRLILEKSLRDIQHEGVSGTPRFMSPEQERGDHDELDERADVYALGAILQAIIRCRENPPKTDARGKREIEKAPAALVAVAAKAMSDLPENRYPSVEDLSREVRAYVEGFATTAQQAGAPTLLWLLIKRHQVVAGLFAASLLAVIIILSVAIIRISQSEEVAVLALEKIKTEQAGKNELGRLAVPQLLAQARDARYKLDYDKALILLNQAGTLDPHHQEVWENIAAIHLGRWEFAEATKALDHLPKPAPKQPTAEPVDLRGVIAKYAGAVESSGEAELRRTKEIFVRDLVEANRGGWPVRQLALAVFFKEQNGNSKTVDFSLLEKTLRWLNPDARDLVFAHEDTPGGLRLKASSKQLREISPLAGLPISILDLSDTGSVGFEWLRDAPLVSVDLSRSNAGEIRILDLWPTIREMRLIEWADRDFGRLGGFRHLERVVVSKIDVGAAEQAVKNIPGPPQVVGE